MQVYNVDIYNESMQLVHHDTVDFETVEYTYDLLSPEDNTIILSYNSQVSLYQYIHIYEDVKSTINAYFGVINGVEKINDEKQIEVSYMDFIASLNNNFVFRADLLQNQSEPFSTTLEECIGDVITAAYIANYDALQNKSIISSDIIYTTYDTINWNIGAVPDENASGMVIQNIYNDLIVQAFKRYGIKVTGTFMPEDLKIHLFIGKTQYETKTIEVDLPNIISKQVIIRRQNKEQLNKLIIYNKTLQYTQQTIYYLHPNGTYNTTNNNRITPVVYDEVEVTVSSNSTFANEAKKKADSMFNNTTYDNYIELEVLNNDTLVNPYDLHIGQVVNIIYKGVVYNSILSGYKRGKTTTLTFGSIRLDLTKILKQEGI